MLRQFVLVTHRWLGLATSVILAIVGTTGAILQWTEQVAILGRLWPLASPLHERLALGYVGHWVVIVASAGAVFLQVGGVVLWWKRKTLRVALSSGWWRMCFDAHHAVGVVFLPFMFVLALTGVLLPFVDGDTRRIVGRLHNGHFPFPINAMYTITTLGFLVQGVTGVVIWWKPRPRIEPPGR